jgi:hypothetical protein
VYYLATNGSDSNDGSFASPWATIGRFLAKMQEFIVPYPYTVTLYIKDGTYSQSELVVVNHPAGSQIQIRGLNTYDRTMSGVGYSGGANAWTLTLNLNSVANIAVGDYVLTGVLQTVVSFGKGRGSALVGIGCQVLSRHTQLESILALIV